MAESELGTLVERAQDWDACDQRFRRHLPPALAAQLRLGDAKDGRLVVVVASPAWKARLRMETALLLEAATAAGLQARVVTIKVVPPVAPSPARPGAPLTAAARATLETAARSMADPELRARLLRLARSGQGAPREGEETESTEGPLEKR